MSPVHLYDNDALQLLIKKRKGETKLGENIYLLTGEADNLVRFAGSFVLVGIPESIGVRANQGLGGAETAWDSFLAAFLNIQETEQLPGAAFSLLGKIEDTDLRAKSANADIRTLRDLTSRLDEQVYPVIQQIIAAKKIPIVIGGGHNNAYPLLKGCNMALRQPVNVINLDAHSDFRAAEGRHSGNGFRYAWMEHLIRRYALLGLHEGYNGSAIVHELKANRNLLPIFWEDIFLREKESWDDALCRALLHVQSDRYGLELDMDAVAHTLSSAATPVGVTPLHAMQYCYSGGSHPGVLYLHLAEATAVRADGLMNPFAGKMLSYLVQAFCKGVLENGTRGFR